MINLIAQVDKVFGPRRQVRLKQGHPLTGEKNVLFCGCVGSFNGVEPAYGIQLMDGSVIAVKAVDFVALPKED